MVRHWCCNERHRIPTITSNGRLDKTAEANAYTIDFCRGVWTNDYTPKDGPAKALAENEDVKEFYLGMSSDGRKSFRDMKSYRRRKRRV
jgi:hypothetical protein